MSYETAMINGYNSLTICDYCPGKLLQYCKQHGGWGLCEHEKRINKHRCFDC